MEALAERERIGACLGWYYHREKKCSGEKSERKEIPPFGMDNLRYGEERK